MEKNLQNKPIRKYKKQYRAFNLFFIKWPGMKTYKYLMNHISSHSSLKNRLLVVIKKKQSILKISRFSPSVVLLISK